MGKNRKLHETFCSKYIGGLKALSDLDRHGNEKTLCDVTNVMPGIYMMSRSDWAVDSTCQMELLLFLPPKQDKVLLYFRH